MAAPSEVAAAVLGEGDGGAFGSWLDTRLEALGVDRAVYAAYIQGVLQEEEEEEKLDALQGILSAFLVSPSNRDTFHQPHRDTCKPLSLLRVSLLLWLSRGLGGVTGKKHTPWEEWLAAPQPDLGKPEGCRCLERTGIPAFLAARFPGVPLYVLKHVLKPLSCVNGRLIVNV